MAKATMPEKTAAAIKQNTVRKPVRKRRERYPLIYILAGVLFLFFLAANQWPLSVDLHAVFAFSSAIFFIGTVFEKGNKQLLSKKTPMIFVILVLQCFLYFLGLFYGVYPKFALQQFLLDAGALFLFGGFYVHFQRSTANIRKAFFAFSIFTAIASLLSIELSTSGYLRSFFEFLAGTVGSSLPEGYAAFETNTRMITITGVPNVYAPIALLAMISSIYCATEEKDNARGRWLNIFLAVIHATAFILCFSLGTILTYIPALALILLSAGKNRAEQAAAHTVSLLFAVLAAAVVFALKDLGILPLVAVLVLASAAAFVYGFTGRIRLPAVSGKTKKLLLAGISALCVALVLCVLFLQGPYGLAGGDTFHRAVSLKPGEHQLILTTDGAGDGAELSVDINSMSYTQAALKERTPIQNTKLKNGEPAVFTVPDDSAAVFFTFTAEQDVTVRRAEITGGNISKTLPLRYLLAPEFVVNRLQGLWVNDNAIQRFIFFRDGIRLGGKSPIIGLGGGAFEGGLLSVTDYYYETRHTHNEYIQRFVDGGLLGLLLILSLVAAVVYWLLRYFKSQRDNALCPLLVGGAAIIFIHAFLEVDFFITSYRFASSLFFAAIAAVCDDGIKVTKKWRKVPSGALAVFLIPAMLLSSGLFAARAILKNDTNEKTLRQAIGLDPMNRYDYMISYLMGTMESKDPEVAAFRETYAQKVGNGINGLRYLMQYYLLGPAPDAVKGVKAAEAFVRENRVKTDVWDSVFALYHTVLDAVEPEPETARTLSDSINSLCAYLKELNGTLPKKIDPELAAYSYLRANTTGALADSRIPCDLDANQVSDIVWETTGDRQEWKMNVYIQNNIYLLQAYQPRENECEILINGQATNLIYNTAEGCYESRFFAQNPVTAQLHVSAKTNQGTEDAYFIMSLTE